MGSFFDSRLFTYKLREVKGLQNRLVHCQTWDLGCHGSRYFDTGVHPASEEHRSRSTATRGTRKPLQISGSITIFRML